MSHQDLIPTILLTAGSLVSLVVIAQFLTGAGR